MRSHEVPESDWKVFRELRERALQRFCDRALARARELSRDESRSPHKRFRKVFRYLQDRNEDLAYAFDNPGRSRMVVQLAAIHGLDLLEPEEFARFTEETRKRARSVVDIYSD